MASLEPRYLPNIVLLFQLLTGWCNHKHGDLSPEDAAALYYGTA